MVEDDEVARLEVEAVQAVAGAFGVVDVFIDDVGGAFGVGCDALADLPMCLCQWDVWWELSHRMAGLDCGCAYLTGPNLPNRSKSSSVLTV